MTAPVSSGSDWAAFAKSEAERVTRGRTFSEPPARLEVDKACPDCGESSHWTRTAVLGETPGLPGIPAMRGGVQMHCYRCNATYVYRDLPPTEDEVKLRNRKLLEQAKIGRVPL